MKYILKEPSLQQIAGVKIVSELFNQEAIKAEIARSIDLVDEKIGQWIELPYALQNKIIKKFTLENTSLKKKMIEKVSALPLPEQLKKNLATLINPLDLAIRNWWFHHEDLVSRMPGKLYWTPQGTVDERRTAELIVKDENEDVEARYKLACMYCFENEISILWKRIPEMRKELFYCLDDNFAGGPYGRDLWDPRSFRNDLVAFWTYTINGKVSELHEPIQRIYGIDISLNEFAFGRAAFGLNRSATEFFYKKLNCKESDRFYLVWCVELLLNAKHFHSGKLEIIFFILNRMSENLRRRAFEYHAFDALESMLRWPYQSFFLETAKKCFQYLALPQNDYRYFGLFEVIIDKMKRNEEDYDYEQLFRELWQHGSANYDNFYRSHFNVRNIIRLYEAEGKELLKYVLERATDLQKEQLLYCNLFEDGNYVPLFIDLEEWDCLKFFLGECITRQETIINFKKYIELRQHSMGELLYAELRVSLNVALQLVEDVIRKWQ